MGGSLPPCLRSSLLPACLPLLTLWRKSFPDVQATLIKIGAQIEVRILTIDCPLSEVMSSQKDLTAERLPMYVSNKNTIIKDTVMVSGGIVLTFIGAYLALNLT
jgi:hypothetical protein